MPCARLACLVMLLLSIAAQPALAAGRPANKYLEQGKSLYKSMNYIEAELVLEKALDVPGNTKAEVCEIYSLLGTIRAVIGSKTRAREAFLKLLQIDPGFQLGPGTSPKILDVFREVKAELLRDISFVGRERIVSQPGELPTIQVDLRGQPEAIGRVDLRYRTNPQEPFLSAPLERVSGGRYRGEIPLISEEKATAEARVEYFVEVRDPAERVLTTLGGPAKPLAFNWTWFAKTESPAPEKAREESRPTPWYSTWWFWTTVGLLAAGAGTGIVIGVTAAGDELPAGSLGILRIEK